MKKSEQTYKIEFNHKEMKNIDFCNIIDILGDELQKSVKEGFYAKTKFKEDRADHCISALSTLIRNFDRLEKEFRNEVKEVA